MNVRSILLGTSLGAVLALPACQGRQERIEITEKYFFPPSPALARVQFVKSFRGSADFQRRRGLLDYLVGTGETQQYELFKPFSLASWKGRIYATDSFGLRALNVFDLENERFYFLGKDPGPGELMKPIHVFVDDLGYKFVSDLKRKLVVVYGPDDVHVRNYGDGVSFLPLGCVAHGDEVYVMDAERDPVEWERNGENQRKDLRRDQILVLDRETGRPLRRIGQHARGPEGFLYASFLAVDRLGHLYLSDFLNHRILKIDRNGNVLLAIGQHGDRVGDFAKPKGVAVDREGLIYAVDAEFHVAQVFDNAGNVLFFFGEPRAPKGAMRLPAGIWIDYHNVEYFRDRYGPDLDVEYLILVANQMSEENRIAVYAFGKRRGFDYPPDYDVATLDDLVEDDEQEILWTLPVFPPDVYRSPPPDEDPYGPGSGR